MNIAVFGGSFDPPHIGHEKIVNKCLDTLDIDKLLIVPTFLNPFKTKSYFSAKERFDLLEDIFFDDRIVVYDFEIKQNKPTPTIDTIKYITKTINPDKIYLIIGADNLSTIDLWKDFSLLKDLVSFVVISRDDIRLKDDIIQFKNIHMDINISSTALRKSLDLKYIPTKIQQKVKKLWKKE
jgi:nicotinate-nucleotide adenylyltransferase